MHGRVCKVDPRFLLPILLVTMGFLPRPGWAVENDTGEDTEPVLVGLLSREEMEAGVPAWVVAGIESEPDIEAAAAMLAALEGSEVMVFLGTWCSDSGRELPRLWRAFDELGVMTPEMIRYIGVNRDKTEPAEWVAGVDLEWVPTILVRRDGKELGRIVESSPNGIERDLLALLEGETEGWVTDSPEVEAERQRD